MKKIIFTALALLTINTYYSQALSWDWASNNPSGTNVDVALAVRTDNSGNVYYTGYTTGTVPGNFITSQNIFLTKKDASGTTVWSKLIGGDATDAGTAIAIDNNDNVYLTGKFQSNTIAFSTSTLTTAGGTDVFVVKFNSAGTEQWVKKFGGALNDEPYGIVADQNGNIFVAGDYTSKTWTVGATTLTNFNQGSGASSATTDIFITKLDATGNPLWAQSFGGNQNDRAKSITTDKTDNVFITGYFFGTFFGAIDLTPPFGSNGVVYTAKLNTTGTVIWAKSGSNTNPGATDTDISNAICSDKNGNIYIAGKLTGQKITFGSFILNNTNTVPFYDSDMFIVKYDASGSEVWAQSIGSTVTDEALSITADTNSTIYVAGYFTSPTLSAGNATLTNTGVNTKDIAIITYDAAGNALWAANVGNTENDEANAVSCDKNNSVYVAGDFKGSGFGSYTIAFGATTLTNSFASNSDAFIAKLGNSGITGIPEHKSTENSFMISPNPSNGEFLLDLHSSSAITITNSLGQTVFYELMNTGKQTIELKDMASGIYFVTAVYESRSFTQKLIIR